MKPPFYNTQSAQQWPPRDMTIDFPSQVPTIEPMLPGLLTGTCTAPREQRPFPAKLYSSSGVLVPLLWTAASPGTTTP